MIEHGLTSEFVPSAEVPLATIEPAPVESVIPPVEPVMVRVPQPAQEPAFRVATTPIQKGQIVGLVRRDREGVVVLPAIYKVMTLRSRGRLELKPEKPKK
jgi:hypothetical protein